MNDNKIGVFDSGVGGLTVLKGLKEALPNETFIYIGDNIHSPYGEKTHEQLLNYTTEIVEYFLKQQVKMIVLACNTTSCMVLEDLRRLFPKVPIIGVTDATCEWVKQDHPQKVLVMATKATIQSNAYQTRIGENNTIGLACPKLVPLIEEGASKEEIAIALHDLIDPYQSDVDSIVLGCTHYPIVGSQIAELYPHIRLYSSSDAVVGVVQKYLHKHQIESSQREKSVIYTTGQLNRFIRSASTFFDFKEYEVKGLSLEVE